MVGVHVVVGTDFGTDRRRGDKRQMPFLSRVNSLFRCIHFGTNYNPKSGLKLPELVF